MSSSANAKDKANGKVRILFVCHGNICRSPMAQAVMQNLVDNAQLTQRFEIDSAATTREELGNPIYPPARRELGKHHIPVPDHRARLVSSSESDDWDYIVAMDKENIRHLARILSADAHAHTRLLLSFAGAAREVADPWYTGDFSQTFADIDKGCRALFAHIMAQAD